MGDFQPQILYFGRIFLRQKEEFWFSNNLSQCSTVVRNTVVRATIKVDGKLQILGTRSPQTSEAIDWKFDSDD